MDIPPETVAASVALAVSYLKAVADKAAEKTGDMLGEATVGRLQGFYDWLTGRISEEPDGKATIEVLESAPDSDSRQQVFEDVVARVANSDGAFASELTDRVKAVRDSSGDTSGNITDTGIVALHGSVSLQGKNVAGRDMTIKQSD